MKITKKILSVFLCLTLAVVGLFAGVGEDFFAASAANCGNKIKAEITTPSFAEGPAIVQAGSRFEFIGRITYIPCDSSTVVEDDGMGTYIKYVFEDKTDPYNSVYGSRMLFSGITIGEPMSFVFTLPDALTAGEYSLTLISMDMECVTHETYTSSYNCYNIRVVDELPDVDEPSGGTPVIPENHEHKEGYKAVKTPATCTADGELGTYCSECGMCYAVESIAAKGHGNAVTVITVPATCTADGERVTYCDCCGLKTGVVSIPAKGHDAGYWTVDYEATADHAGQKVLLCTKCDAVIETEEIPVHKHDGQETVEIRPATCTQSGIEGKYCIGCGSYYDVKTVAAKGHGETYALTTKAATCTAAGEEALCCSVCSTVTGTQTVSALGHDEGVWVTSKEATCTTEGEEIKKCTACGEVTDKKAVEATDHIPGKWEITKDSTCTQTGLKQQSCACCGKLLGEPVVIEAHEHQPGAWVTAIEAGCEKEGEKIQSCSVCKGVLASEKINALGHNYTAWYKNGDSTHSKDCTRCQATVTANCNFSDTVTAPTCTDGGFTTHVCDDCGYTYIDAYTDALGHSWSGWSDNEDGTHSRVCEACEEEETAEHNWSEWVYNGDSTLCKNGTKTRFCYDCSIEHTEEANHTTWICQVIYPIIVFVGNFVHKIINLISLNWLFPELTIYPQM